MHGRYPVRTPTFGRKWLYTNNTYEAHAANTAVRRGQDNISKGWSANEINILIKHAKNEGHLSSKYRGLNLEIWRGLKHVNVTGHKVLVIGSESPWVEALAIAAGAQHVWTLEYAQLITDHRQITTVSPPQFLVQARQGILAFDTVVTASSLEHSGLGRYNDGLNPWGDILAVARGWCTTLPHAWLVIAVPMSWVRDGTEPQSPQEAQDVEGLYFNNQRVYGPVRYPYLVTNWHFQLRVKPRTKTMWAQIVYIFKRGSAPKL